MRKMLVILTSAVLLSFVSPAQADCGRLERRPKLEPREVPAGKDGEFRYVVDVTGGEGPFTYRWSGTVGGQDFTSSERQTPIFRPWAERFAEVVVTDRGGCSEKTTIGKQIAVASRSCGVTGFSPAPTPGAVQSAGVEITFPGTAPSWRVVLENRGLKGVALGHVEMRRAGETTWNTILKSAGPTEIFVPYHNGVATSRYYDMRYCGSSPGNPHPCLRKVTLADAAPNQAQLITFPGSPYATVVAECRDAGLAALCKSPAGGETGNTARYKEVVLWSVYDTGNYDYVVEYGFRNDGTITFRMGATGYNNIDHPDNPHMHDVLWRVDTDLFGVKGDRAYQVAHVEHPGDLHAIDSQSFYATEGTLNWSDAQFTSLLIDSGVHNALGNHMGYELTPWDRKGTAEHHGGDEKWTHEDFWITANNPGEDGTGPGANGWGTSWFSPDDYVMHYASRDAALTPGSGPQLLTSLSDLVVWYRSAAHHHPRDEDRRETDLPGQITGLTLMHWQGFDLEPHNVFTFNPVLPVNDCYPQ